MSSSPATRRNWNAEVSEPTSHMNAKSWRDLSWKGRNIPTAVPNRVGKWNEKSRYW